MSSADDAGTTRRVWWVSACLAAAAAAGQLALVGTASAPAGGVDIPWPVLLVAVVLAERVTVHLGVGRDGEAASFSLSELPFVVGVVFASPLEVVTATVLGTGIALLRDRAGAMKLAFNLALVWLTAVAGLTTWHLVGGGADPTSPAGWLAVLAVVVAVDVTSALGVAAVIRASEGRVDRATARELATAAVLEAVSNGSFAVVTIAVLATDWRAVWALGIVGAVLAAAYRAYLALVRQRDQLTEVMGFAAALETDLRATAVATTVVTRVADLLGAHRVELSWVDGSQRRCVRFDGETVALELDCAAGLAGRLGAGERRLLASRGTKDSALRDALARAGVRDAVAVPVTVAGTTVGTLVAADRRGEVESFDAGSARLLGLLAAHVGPALANGRLADRLRDEAAEREHEARHDPLTGLPNRRAFLDAVRDGLPDGRGAVLLVELDAFKEINDTLGHRSGDELLREIGARLALALPSATVARLGGDEFAVLLVDADAVDALRVAARVREVLGATFRLRDLPVHVDASVGISLAPDHGADPDTLLQRADVAMYAAKTARSGAEVYAAEKDPYSPRRLSLSGEAAQAIDRGELAVVFQPKVSAADDTVVGVEALVRWPHPQHGLIPPDEFIPVLERTDLMLPLTLFVLSEALRQQRRWTENGWGMGVAVNVSTRTLLDPALPRHVARLLGEHGTPAGALTLEITECSLIGDPQRTAAVLGAISDLGVGLSIDDFGTGYSSLAYLKRLPVDEIKIDRSFVGGLATSSDDAAIVGATLDLAARLRKRTVAEGIEDERTWEVLRRLGCDLGQGYHFSRPLDADRLTEWLATSPRSGVAPSVRTLRAAG